MFTFRGANQRYRGQQQLCSAITSSSNLLLVSDPLPCLATPLSSIHTLKTLDRRTVVHHTCPAPHLPCASTMRNPSYFCMFHIDPLSQNTRRPAGDYRPSTDWVTALQTTAASCHAVLEPYMLCRTNRCRMRNHAHAPVLSGRRLGLDPESLPLRRRRCREPSTRVCALLPRGLAPRAPAGTGVVASRRVAPS